MPGIIEPGGRRAASSSSSSSSIEEASWLSAASDGGGGREDGEEVQSAYKGSLNTLGGLKESLPMRRGISIYYNGKSKSFASLTDIPPSTSIKDLGKPDDAYTRKRRNILSYDYLFERRHLEGGISKRLATSTPWTTALGAPNVSHSSSNSISSGEVSHPPPLHPPNMSTSGGASQRNSLQLRSFSLSDPQDMAGSGFSTRSTGNKHKKFK